MQCPHCGVVIHQDLMESPLFAGLGDARLKIGWSVLAQLCPDCGKPIIFFVEGKPTFDSEGFDGVIFDGNRNLSNALIWPRTSSRTCPAEVPDDLKEDFLESAAVLPFSAKASAALSRRCLQGLLVDYAKAKSKDLSKQIQEVIQGHSLSSDLAGELDAVRNIGNFAAHPQKDKSTGEILPVEAHEAEWNLDVLEELFDHYFVKPERAKQRKQELNLKLAAGGKPPLPID